MKKQSGRSFTVLLTLLGGLLLIVGTGPTIPLSVAATVASPPVERDFNGDGKADILWRDASGVVAIWFMDGPTIVSTALLGTVDPKWVIVGVGDFNGDRKADILWRYTCSDQSFACLLLSGTVVIWLMDGAVITRTARAGSGPVPTAWSIERVADFNSDGRADILWRHSSGTLSIWFMNGTSIMVTGQPGGAGPDWQVQPQ